MGVLSVIGLSCSCTLPGAAQLDPMLPKANVCGKRMIRKSPANVMGALVQILDKRVADDLRNARPLMLELGSGGEVRDGYYGVDLLARDGVAIQADLNEPLDQLPDNCVSGVISFHCLEHVDRLLPLMRELHRIMRPGAVADIVVPHFSNPYHYSDPTHVRTFGLYTMHYFSDEGTNDIRYIPTFYSDTRFSIKSIEIRLLDRRLPDRLFAPFLGRVINRSLRWQDRYERRLCRLFPASEIRYVFSPVK